MEFSLPDHYCSFQLQPDKFRKPLQSVSHLTMTYSIDKVVSQSTCKIVYTEFGHVLIEFVRVIKIHTFEDFLVCILAYVRVGHFWKSRFNPLELGA